MATRRYELARDKNQFASFPAKDSTKNVIE